VWAGHERLATRGLYEISDCIAVACARDRHPKGADPVGAEGAERVEPGPHLVRTREEALENAPGAVAAASRDFTQAELRHQALRGALSDAELGGYHAG